MQTSCHEAPLTALATNQSAENNHFAEVAHHASDQLVYQGAVVLAIILLLVSLWSL